MRIGKDLSHLNTKKKKRGKRKRRKRARKNVHGRPLLLKPTHLRTLATMTSRQELNPTHLQVCFGFKKIWRCFFFIYTFKLFFRGSGFLTVLKILMPKRPKKGQNSVGSSSSRREFKTHLIFSRFCCKYDKITLFHFTHFLLTYFFKWQILFHSHETQHFFEKLTVE